ncbi:DMT family transporter [Photobacterium angustum]|uniref:EamA family transporter n=1 Tax=Photobacterium angustum TaxID=661 RepID=A0A2S7VRM5_PHOAN|nr:DMT family transporter [Photobacterium angustum]PQJ64807.1 EamA family transporter [Photobacterium angustum]
MKQTAVSLGILLLIFGNLSASLSDVAVKLLNGEVHPLQYMFLRQVISLIIILPFWLSQPKPQREVGSWKINTIRAYLVLAGSSMLLVALTYLPLATANALFYAAPLLMIPLSIVLLGEYPTKGKVVATAIGFIGILIVLRPTQFHWAAIAALGTATTLALYNVLVRKLPQSQTVSSTLFWTSLLSLPVATPLAWYFWQPISLENLGLIAASALFTLGYQGCVVLAYRQSETHKIGLAEYSGLIFVALFGWIWFNESLDSLTLIGILLIVLPMMPRPKRKKFTTQIDIQ